MFTLTITFFDVYCTVSLANVENLTFLSLKNEVKIMNIHMTSGTKNFLLPLMEKMSGENMILMQNNQNTLLLHETENKKSKFQQPKSYRIIDSRGNLRDGKFIAIQYIPLTDEGKPIFDFKYQQFSISTSKINSLFATRVLAPYKGNTYVIITAWDAETSFKNWQATHPIAKKLQEEQDSKKEMLADPAYSSFYYIQTTDK